MLKFILGIIAINAIVRLLKYRNKPHSEQLEAFSKITGHLITPLTIGCIFAWSFGFRYWIFGLLPAILTAIVGLKMLSSAFKYLIKRTQFPSLIYFYYTGVICTFVTVIMLFSNLLQLDGMSDYWQVCATYALTVVIFESIGIATVGTGAFVVHALVGNRPMQPNTVYNHTRSADKYSYYKSAGLSDSEITFLREQLATAKSSIQQIEQHFNQNAKLRTIGTRYNTIEVCQNYFKDIVAQPKRLVEASQFLYKLLPSLEDLLAKYNEINGHVAKNKQTYLILEKSASTIEQLCEKVNDSYVEFHHHDIDAMEDEIIIASRSIQEDTFPTNDSVEDLINDYKE